MLNNNELLNYGFKMQRFFKNLFASRVLFKYHAFNALVLHNFLSSQSSE